VLEQWDDILTPAEACEVLKIGKSALYQSLNSGKLKGMRNGKVWRIPKDSIRAFILTQSGLDPKHIS